VRAPRPWHSTSCWGLEGKPSFCRSCATSKKGCATSKGRTRTTRMRACVPGNAGDARDVSTLLRPRRLATGLWRPASTAVLACTASSRARRCSCGRRRNARARARARTHTHIPFSHTRTISLFFTVTHTLSLSISHPLSFARARFHSLISPSRPCPFANDTISVPDGSREPVGSVTATQTPPASSCWCGCSCRDERVS